MAPSNPSKLGIAFWETVPEPRARRAFWALALTLLAFRLLVLAVVPLDLSGDEAYYWEWGRHPDWGYFSKPPGIAWLMALAGKVGGDTTFGIRMFAALLGTGSLAFVFLLALRLYGPAVAMVTAIAFVANPANAALNLTLTIDAPLMFFWTLSLYAFWRFVEPGVPPGRSDSSAPPAAAPTQRSAWGVALFCGLAGGLLSKQMMLVFHPVAILFLASAKELRPNLRRPALWIILIGSLAAWLPPLWWNVQNDWITVRHTLHHFEGGGVSWGRQVGRFFEFVGSQFGIITPVFYSLLLLLTVAVPFCWRRLTDRERFLWLYGGPALLVMLAMGLRQRINPNWPAVFYASMIVLLTGWAAGRWSLDSAWDRWRRAFDPGMKIGVAFAVAVYAVVFVLSFGLVRLPGLDPTARLRGWSQLARDVDAARREMPGGMEMLLITQSHRFMTSELAFYLHDQPRVYIYNSNPKAIESQHDLWETPAVHAGRDALLVVQGDANSLAPGLTNRFESVTIHGILRYPQQGKALQTVTLAVGHDLRSWPGLND